MAADVALPDGGVVQVQAAAAEGAATGVGAHRQALEAGHLLVSNPMQMWWNLQGMV